MSRFLTILEISQKQAFIFASNKLKDNVRNSAIIESVLSANYLMDALKSEGYSNEENMVYSGGGHTILEFQDMNEAKRNIRILTEKIYKEFEDIEVFAKVIEFDEQKSAKENINTLISELEKKKAIRKSAFRQGSYGLEFIDTNTLSRVSKSKDEEALKRVEDEVYKKEKSLFPEGFDSADKFENLGGSKNDSNFIAVVHIDGNGMGKRVEEFYEKIKDHSWEETKKELRQFSEGIANDFENAYRGMVNRIANSIMQGSEVYTKLNLSKNENKYFPIRRVITAGDDVCFVTEGRIGIECARIFIEELGDCVNPADGKGYSACAGVAIVHQKYPFYRAYELSEMLCSNAKKYGASISPEDNGRSISSIDWHVEFGELKDSLSEIRKSYINEDGYKLEMRPYIVAAPDSILKDEKFSYKLYSNFKSILKSVISKENSFATGKIKNLRTVLKENEESIQYYLTFNKMNAIAGKNNDGKVFVQQADGENRSILFDAIEIIDTFIAID